MTADYGKIRKQLHSRNRTIDGNSIDNPNMVSFMTGQISLNMNSTTLNKSKFRSVQSSPLDHNLIDISQNNIEKREDLQKRLQVHYQTFRASNERFKPTSPKNEKANLWAIDKVSRNTRKAIEQSLEIEQMAMSGNADLYSTF